MTDDKGEQMNILGDTIERNIMISLDDTGDETLSACILDDLMLCSKPIDFCYKTAKDSFTVRIDKNEVRDFLALLENPQQFRDAVIKIMRRISND